MNVAGSLISLAQSSHFGRYSDVDFLPLDLPDLVLPLVFLRLASDTSHVSEMMRMITKLIQYRIVQSKTHRHGESCLSIDGRCKLNAARNAAT